jgi:lipoate-protein ligase A
MAGLEASHNPSQILRRIVQNGSVLYSKSTEAPTARLSVPDHGFASNRSQIRPERVQSVHKVVPGRLEMQIQVSFGISTY